MLGVINHLEIDWFTYCRLRQIRQSLDISFDFHWPRISNTNKIMSLLIEMISNIAFHILLEWRIWECAIPIFGIWHYLRFDCCYLFGNVLWRQCKYWFCLCMFLFEKICINMHFHLTFNIPLCLCSLPDRTSDIESEGWKNRWKPRLMCVLF